MSFPPPALRSCASCAEQTEAKLCCARCRTDYCSPECQAAHWASGGHKKDCKGIARANRDTNLVAQSRALARVAHMSGGAPADARCMFCLDWGDAADPIMRGCACRGSLGWTHMSCLVKCAEAAQAPPPGEPRFAAWVSCSTCKQSFTGQVQLRLAIALWAKHARAVETNIERTSAANAYTNALGVAGEHAEAARLQRGVLDVLTRTCGPEHIQTLRAASNLAALLINPGEHAEAAVLLRTTLTVETRTLGPDDQNTLATQFHLSSVLINQEEYEEAEALGRELLEKERRIFGRGHNTTLATSGNLAYSLSRQGKHAEAAEIYREVLVQKTRLLGAEHESTLVSASNLAHSLSHCGQNTEAEQLLRETLAMSLRTLGLVHETTQNVLRKLCALSLTEPR